MTSSAVIWMISGTESLRALAVFWLMTSSNLIGDPARHLDHFPVLGTVIRMIPSSNILPVAPGFETRTDPMRGRYRGSWEGNHHVFFSQKIRAVRRNYCRAAGFFTNCAGSGLPDATGTPGRTAQRWQLG